MRCIICALLILVFPLCGCSFISQSHRDSKEAVSVPHYVESGKILDPRRLKEGGKVAVIAFKAGEDVEANDDLDKISLMIVRGVSEVLASGGGNLKAVFEDDAKTADFILEGHVTKMRGPSTFKRFVLRKLALQLAVEGKLIDRKNNRMVAVFTDAKKFSDKKQDFNQLGATIGQDIGRFLVNEIEK